MQDLQIALKSVGNANQFYCYFFHEHKKKASLIISVGKMSNQARPHQLLESRDGISMPLRFPRPPPGSIRYFRSTRPRLFHLSPRIRVTTNHLSMRNSLNGQRSAFDQP